ncbi:hypothetical protein RND81_12G062400 [Saponaria officinalis]|uniref:Uncharacterized protein n=1 Tax=Saponaria officinalis TaxID=3572 RepID=A0AAW1H6S8_SAPOF
MRFVLVKKYDTKLVWDLFWSKICHLLYTQFLSFLNSQNDTQTQPLTSFVELGNRKFSATSTISYFDPYSPKPLWNMDSSQTTLTCILTIYNIQRNRKVNY